LSEMKMRKAFFGGLLFLYLVNHFTTFLFLGQPIIPNLLLITGYRNLTEKTWQKYDRLNKKVIYPPQEIPIIQAADFSMETLRDATNNWNNPALVKGLFNNTKALNEWHTGRIVEKLGMHTIPVVDNGTFGQSQNERSRLTFGEAFNEIVDTDSSKYIFFPAKARYRTQKDIQEGEMFQRELDELVVSDLELDRIWKGFGTSVHPNFKGAQVVVGKGKKNPRLTTGSGWHCAIGGNWFIQVHGGKRWWFVDQEHADLLLPLRIGKIAFHSSRDNMIDVQQHIPTKYADVMAGDLLFNPDYEWHAIQNHEGLSIAVPIRELNVTEAFANHPWYTTVTAASLTLFNLFDYDIGGYPPNYDMKVAHDD